MDIPPNCDVEVECGVPLPQSLESLPNLGRGMRTGMARRGAPTKTSPVTLRVFCPVLTGAPTETNSSTLSSIRKISGQLTVALVAKTTTLQ